MPAIRLSWWIGLFLGLGLWVVSCVPTQVSTPKIELFDGGMWTLEVQDPNIPQTTYNLSLYTRPGTTFGVPNQPDYRAKRAKAENREGIVVFTGEALLLTVDLDQGRRVSCNTNWNGSAWTGRTRLINGSVLFPYSGTCKAIKK